MSSLDLSKIGMSDLAVCAGISRWRRPIDLWQRIVQGAKTEETAPGL